jgi:hypothetical protein
MAVCSIRSRFARAKISIQPVHDVFNVEHPLEANRMFGELWCFRA